MADERPGSNVKKSDGSGSFEGTEELKIEDLVEAPTLPPRRPSRPAPPSPAAARKPPPPHRPPSPPPPSSSAVTARATERVRPAPSRLQRLCEAQLDHERDPARKARLHYELGRLHELELRDPRRAAEHYRLALHHAPEHVAAIRGARRTLEALGEHAALPALFDAEVAVTREPTARALLLADKAHVFERRLDQSPNALATYREALALDPGNVTILKGIERAHQRSGDQAALAQTYLALADAVEDAPLRAAWIARAAHITETRLGNAPKAAALYESALATDPHAAPSLAHVKRLAATQARWQALVRALREEHELCRDEDARQAILASIARVQETQLGDTQAAIATIEEARRVRPNDRALLETLVRLGEAAGRPPVTALARLAELTEAPDALAALCHRLGRTFEQDLHDVERARPWYERALVADAAHAPAALALARIYEARQDWAELLRVLAIRAHAITDTEEQATLFHRMGTLLDERLDQPTDAAAQHAYALGLDPDHHDAFRALTRLYAASERWRELVELYARAIERAPHDQEAIAWLFRMGNVLEDRLGDLEGALHAYHRILALDPPNLGALHAVVRAAERAGHFDQVVQALRTEAQLTVDEARRDALLHRAAMITAEELGDRAGGMAALEQLLASTPQHRPSLEALAALATQAGQWSKAVAVHGRILPLLSSAKERARLHHRVGEIEATQIGDDGSAVQAFTEALALDPDFEPAREARIAALERMRAYPELTRALEERLARLNDPAERARAATELGAIYEEQLGDRARALASYEAALRAAPLHRPALDARERLLTDGGETARLAQALQEEAAQTEDEFERVQAALRAALVLSEEGGKAALGAFRPVFSAKPGHVGALLAVEDAYLRAGDDAGLSATYERLDDAAQSSKAKLAVRAELAAAKRASGGDAREVYETILALEPDDPRALEALAAAAARAGDGAREQAMYERLAAGRGDPSVLASHHARVAELRLEARDARGALSAYRAALTAEPQSLGATEGFTRAARAARDPNAMREASRYETLVTRDRPTAVALLREAAQIFAESDREDDAAACYGEALSLAPDDAEAATGLMATMMRGRLVPHLVELLARAAQAATDPSRASTLHLSIALLSAEVLHDLPAAVVATRRALAARPEHRVALTSLATYLERNAQWAEAAETLEQVIARTDGAARIEAHLRVARIAEEHLSAPDRAMQHLRTVLTLDANDAAALTALVRLERVKGNDPEALRLAKQLITVVRDEEHRAAAYAELAELEKKRGNIAEAAKAAYWAMTVRGPLGSAGRLYRGLIQSAPQHASWEHYTSALLRYIERARAKGGDLAAGYRELARVLTKVRQQPERAIEALREGTQLLPSDTGIGLALVAALRTRNAEREALTELRRLVSVDVGEPAVWRIMAEVLERAGMPDGEVSALAPVVVLGQASDEEARRVRARAPRTALAPASILGEAGLQRLIETHALTESPAVFIRAFAEVLTKVEGIDHERWGVNKRERIRAGDPHPVRALADRIARIFGGVPEFDLFVSVASVQRPFILAGSPPALLVPRGLESAPEPAQAFHLARPLALLSRGLHPLDHIDDASMERILVAAVRQFDPAFTLEAMIDEGDLEREVKRVKNAIGFFSRSRIQEAAAAFAASPPPSYPAWAREIRRLAARAALLVSDDFVATLEALGEPLGPDNYATDLARFWVSDPAMRFRHAVLQPER